jgi:hypothetical protein
MDDQQLKQFAVSVVDATRQYIADGKDADNPSVIENIMQYTDPDHVLALGRIYREWIDVARDEGRETIIDIASGINWAKFIDPTIVTSNPEAQTVNGYQYLKYINNALNVPVDIILGDMRVSEQWLDVGSLKFDCAMAIRFMPFRDKVYMPDDYKRFVHGVRNCLTPSGVVWLNTENEGMFFVCANIFNHKSAWERQIISERTNTLESVKHKLDMLE